MSGDARLELWEELCTCGGSRKSPDVRMCRCLAPSQAGLDCQGCGRGVMLIKSSATTGHMFWGCSNYKKGGCKFTKRFGPPYDRDAARQLERIRGAKKRKLEAEQAELECIVDPHELEWRSYCRCDGAKNLNTFECYMQSEGGCGFLALCPKCGEGLFLKDGRYGRYWQCHNRHQCDFRTNYQPHLEPGQRKKARIVEPTNRDDSIGAFKGTAAGTGLSSNVADQPKPAATLSETKKPPSTPNRHVTPAEAAASPSVLSPEQKAMIEAKRQAAIAKRMNALESSTTGHVTPAVDAASSSTATLSSEQKAMLIEAKRRAAIATLCTLESPGRTTPAAASVAASSAPTSSALSPEQKAMIEAKRQAALATLKSSTGKATSSANKTEDSTSSVCKNPRNESLYQAFSELAQLYQKEGNYNAKATYSRVAAAICLLDEEVTADNAKGMGKGKTKVPNIGKASADKMYEFVTTGKISKLEEKKAGAVSQPQTTSA